MPPRIRASELALDALPVLDPPRCMSVTDAAELKSLTWWGGALLILLGALAILAPSGEVSELGALVSMLIGGGGSAPAQMIGTGLGLIGLRDVLARKFDP